jgi:hypothetical protein
MAREKIAFKLSYTTRQISKTYKQSELMGCFTVLYFLRFSTVLFGKRKHSLQFLTNPKQHTLAQIDTTAKPWLPNLWWHGSFRVCGPH